MGSILIKKSGVETIDIPKEKRDKALRDFFDMLDKAINAGDKSFMSIATYQHQFSYGEYYPAFVNMSWDQFSQIKSLEGVSFNTYYYLAHNFKIVRPTAIENDSEIENKQQPIGEGGFERPGSPLGFLCDINRWRIWHRDYLIEHPELIKWENGNDFLPNIECVEHILDAEIYKYLQNTYKDQISNAENKDKEIRCIYESVFADSIYHVNEELSQPIKANARALFFHRVIIPSFAHQDLAGYCIEIGDKVCKENFYIFEQELSSKEQLESGAMRHIWSILKKGVKQYISFDFHKGMFEFHDQHGTHLGEFLFDGSYNAQAQADHNLRTIG